MPQIETVIGSAGTSPVDFTLHDDQHSFRVAERMFAILGQQGALLTDVELCQLLLSAYLHDIGMSPSRSTITSHYQYLCSGDDRLLNPIERQLLQHWLDESWPGVDIPMSGINTATGIALAEEICGYYCRARHNDWSEEWIDENLKSVSPGLYPGWASDLITLCKSHHEGYSELLTSKYDARLVGSRAETLNLRYLAAILRMADVLEFDPERTPEIILRHRNIAPNSRIYWYRDHGIAFSMNVDGGELIFSARTPNAVIHNAVLSVADLVNAELVLCRNLSLYGAYLRGAMKPDDRERYAWKLPMQLSLDVREQEGKFTYIDGTFQPEVTKLLELLSGTQLYSNRLAAVRELIQNAADSIAEQIAYERLQQDDPGNPEYEVAFASLHKIRITFEFDGARYWLRCNDDGVGLTKRHIQTRLLRSGSRNRPDFKALEREAENRGFKVFRTGQFGIGLLSYFMIADLVEFTTRRSDATKDGGDASWAFVTEGVASFGELTKGAREKHGTDVRLRLREEVIDGDSEGWFDLLLDYIRRTVRHLPCKIEIRSNLRNPAIQWSVGPGWTALPTEFDDKLISEFCEDRYFGPNALLTFEEEASKQKTEGRFAELRSSARERLRWFGPIEARGESWQIRYWLPYFELNGGASVAFIDLVDSNVQQIPDDRDALFPKARVLTSWKGFALEAPHLRLEYGVAEIDLLSGAEIAIDRTHISNLDRAAITEAVRGVQRDARDRFLAEHKSSHFQVINRQAFKFIRKYAAPLLPNSYWINHGKLQPVSYPFVVMPVASYERRAERNYLGWNGKNIPVMSPIVFSSSSYLNLAREIGSPQLGLHGVSHIRPVGLWTAPPAQNQLFWTSSFPLGWEKLLYVRANGIQFWNAGHDLTRLLSKHPNVRLRADNVEGQFRESLSSDVLAVRFLFLMMTEDIRPLQALKDRYPSEFERFVVLLGGDKRPIYWWSFDSIYSPATKTCMLSHDKVLEQRALYEQRYVLLLPDGETLSPPKDGPHVLNDPHEV
ncbi:MULTISPECIES: hypothetical protein [unclassified Bradyrhizobium]|nr:MULTISPECIES: hypothetical protein [unclassified Bradyrhizobium]